MFRLDKCLLAKKLGFEYDYENGYIITPTKKILSKKTKNGYLMITLRDENRKTYYLLAHQYVYWLINGFIVDLIDHIDGNKENNKISNLRSVTKSENAMNMKNVKGASYCKRSNRWIANIMVNYKKIYLGSFKTEEDAINCYKENKNKYHIIN